MQVKEVLNWLAQFGFEDAVAIDDDGMRIVAVDDPSNFLEIGGLPDEEEEEERNYSIWRYYAPHMNKENEKVRTGLTEAEAKEHCADPSTSCSEWFEGFHKES